MYDSDLNHFRKAPMLTSETMNLDPKLQLLKDNLEKEGLIIKPGFWTRLWRLLQRLLFDGRNAGLVKIKQWPHPLFCLRCFKYKKDVKKGCSTIFENGQEYWERQYDRAYRKHATGKAGAGAGKGTRQRRRRRLEKAGITRLRKGDCAGVGIFDRRRLVTQTGKRPTD